MLDRVVAEKGIDILVNGAQNVFFREATIQEVETQRAVYENRVDITNILTEEQEIAKLSDQPFRPAQNEASQRASKRLNTGIRSRLTGAYHHYRNGNELECIRHIMLAMGVVCDVIGWTKASAYINEQNDVLYDKHKNENPNAPE